MILRAVSLSMAPGERVALMGRNGAGKSTLLRHAAGLMKPTRGKVRAEGRVALLLQNPTDYLVHETVAEEALASGAREPSACPSCATAIRATSPAARSSGSRSRSCSATPSRRPAVVCLDEPTRGMDRGRKRELAELLRSLPSAASSSRPTIPSSRPPSPTESCCSATGAPIADGPTAEILTGGTYFATETARILGGAARADARARASRCSRSAPRSRYELAARRVHDPGAGARRRVRLV